jgi:staphyloferrin B biosynthesis citrate synthase
MQAPAHAHFRKRFLAREPLVGSFIKTPTSHAIEILGQLGFDFVVIDEEHAPFDRVAIDMALLAARAANTAGFVRVADPSASKLLAVLDDGATGVMVPHVSTVERARDIVAACRYRGGKRGFSPSARAGGYGRASMWQHVDEQDANTTVMAMIEDPEALENLDAILAVDGLDGIFIGRGDLTVALGAPSMTAPAVDAAVTRILDAAARAGKPGCVMVANAAEAAQFRTRGASAFIVSSDQGFMRQAANRTLEEFRAAALVKAPS